MRTAHPVGHLSFATAGQAGVIPRQSIVRWSSKGWMEEGKDAATIGVGPPTNVVGILKEAGRGGRMGIERAGLGRPRRYMGQQKLEPEREVRPVAEFSTVTVLYRCGLRYGRGDISYGGGACESRARPVGRAHQPRFARRAAQRRDAARHARGGTSELLGEGCMRCMHRVPDPKRGGQARNAARTHACGRPAYWWSGPGGEAGRREFAQHTAFRSRSPHPTAAP